MNFSDVSISNFSAQNAPNNFVYIVVKYLTQGYLFFNISFKRRKKELHFSDINPPFWAWARLKFYTKQLKLYSTMLLLRGF